MPDFVPRPWSVDGCKCEPCRKVLRPPKAFTCDYCRLLRIGNLNQAVHKVAGVYLCTEHGEKVMEMFERLGIKADREAYLK